MRTRRIGRDGPEVSVVGLGCNNFGTRLDAAATKEVVDAALDAGVTLFDTADVYGQGQSEEYLGAALRGRDAVIATKWGKEMDDAPDLPRGSREYLRWACEQSLSRLGVERIDLYQMHEPDPATPFEETLGALQELVDEGKVAYAGSSNYEIAQLEEADWVAQERGTVRFVSAQNRLSLIRREPELLAACERLEIGMLPYFPLESGLLTGKYRRGEEPPEGTRLAQRQDWLTDEAFDEVDRLQRFADDRGLSLLDVAIGGLAALSAIASVIAGATKPEQVRANAAAGRWEPSAADLESLTQPG